MTPTEQLAAAEYAHKGMTMDVRNMLKQAGQCNRNTGYEYDLNQLGEHLRELKTRWLAGDEAVIAEFFALYRIN